MATATTEGNVLEAKPRDSKGKNEARRLRRSGQVPAAGAIDGGEGAGGGVLFSAVARILSAPA